MCSKVYVSGSMGEMPSSCTALKREDTPAALGGVCTIWAWKGNLPSLVCSGGSGGLLEEGQRATGWGGSQREASPPFTQGAAADHAEGLVQPLSP